MTVFILLKANFFLGGVRGEVFDGDGGGVGFFAQPAGGVEGQALGGGGVLSAACCLLVERWRRRLETILATHSATWSALSSWLVRACQSWLDTPWGICSTHTFIIIMLID